MLEEYRRNKVAEVVLVVIDNNEIQLLNIAIQFFFVFSDYLET